MNNFTKFYYIELPKFRSQEPDMCDTLNQWLSLIDMERGDLLDMAKAENEEIKKAEEDYEFLTGDPELQRLEELRLIEQLEKSSALRFAENNGITKGRAEEKKVTAKKMIELNIPINQIIEITGLSKKEIEELKTS